LLSSAAGTGNLGGGVLVVTDRYPPSIAGGAEISLHIVLRELAASHRVAVAVLGSDDSLPREDVVDGVPVIRLPRCGPWPFHLHPRRFYDDALAAPPLVRLSMLMTACLAYAVKGPGKLANRTVAIAAWLAHGTNLPAAKDTLAPDSGAPAALHQLIDRMRPCLIHADNCDSICAVAERRDVPLVGFVRDNRFLCGRQDQAAQIRGRTCQSCAAACIEGRSKLDEFDRKLLLRTAANRRASLERMTRVVAASDFLVRQLSSLVPTGIVRRVANPVDLPATGEADPAARQGKIDIAIIGSLVKKKGQAALLRHLPEIRGRIPGVHLHFAGAGPDRAKMEELVRTLQAEDGVTLHGHLSRDALYAMLRRCDIVAIPSLWAEPFGRSAIEAAAAALPAVAFAVGGLPELIEHERTGLLAAAGDFKQFISLLAGLADAPDWRAALGAAARRKIGIAHAPRTIAAELAEVWREAELAFHGTPSTEQSNVKRVQIIPL
jgi:glycosyltransferase involved in cell wall biosynthesis